MSTQGIIRACFPAPLHECAVHSGVTRSVITQDSSHDCHRFYYRDQATRENRMLPWVVGAVLAVAAYVFFNWRRWSQKLDDWPFPSPPRFLVGHLFDIGAAKGMNEFLGECADGAIASAARSTVWATDRARRTANSVVFSFFVRSRSARSSTVAHRPTSVALMGWQIKWRRRATTLAAAPS
jgi:hypothetical protein